MATKGKVCCTEHACCRSARRRVHDPSAFHRWTETLASRDTQAGSVGIDSNSNNAGNPRLDCAPHWPNHARSSRRYQRARQRSPTLTDFASLRLPKQMYEWLFKTRWTTTLKGISPMNPLPKDSAFNKSLKQKPKPLPSGVPTFKPWKPAQPARFVPCKPAQPAKITMQKPASRQVPI